MQGLQKLCISDTVCHEGGGGGGVIWEVIQKQSWAACLSPSR